MESWHCPSLPPPLPWHVCMCVPVPLSFPQSVTRCVTLSLYLSLLDFFSLTCTERSANRSRLLADMLRVHVRLSQVFLESFRPKLLNVPGPGVTSNYGRHLKADGIFFPRLGGPFTPLALARHRHPCLSELSVSMCRSRNCALSFSFI